MVLKYKTLFIILSVKSCIVKYHKKGKFQKEINIFYVLKF